MPHRAPADLRDRVRLRAGDGAVQLAGWPARQPGPAGDPRAAVTVLRLAGVTRRFGATTALDGLDLDVGGGEVVGLLGHNGAGKTTVVRLLAGLLAPDRGVVTVAGRDPVADGPAVRRVLGVLPARPVVDDRLTGRQDLRFAADVFGVPAAGLDARIDAALARFDLAGRGGERIGGYSSGMRQRLALARVLLPDPEVLLLDEPTSALDPVATRQVRRLVADLSRDAHRTVVLCTHDLAEAEQLCDRVVVLEHGRVVASGAPADLAAQHGTGGVLLEVGPDQADRARDVVLATARDVDGGTGDVAADMGEGTAGVEVAVEAAGRLQVAGLSRRRTPAVVAALVGAGVDVLEVRRLDPTLEEVYLALHDQRASRSAVAR